MDPFDGSKMIPTGPKDGGQGRRHVSPVWWSSDDSGVVSIAQNNRRNDFALQDGTIDRTVQQQRPVQMRVPNPIDTTRLRSDTMLSPNRLRRRPATASLSREYRESGARSARESREAGSVGRRSIRQTAVTQGHAEGTNYIPEHSRQQPAVMNQPELVKISSDTRRVDAQTAAASRDTGVGDSAGGQQDAHKASRWSSSSTEDAHTRSSIASAEDASSPWAGNVSANTGPVQHFEAPNVSPQRAEFLNVQSNSVRHEAPPPLPSRDHGTPQNQSEEQEPDNIRRLRSVMAKYEAKVEAHVRARQRPRGPVAMPALVAPYHAPDYHSPTADIPSSRHRRDRLVLEELPRRGDSRLLRAEDIPECLLERSRETRASRQFQEGGSHSYSVHEVQVSNGDFVLGQARAVRFSRPGRPTVVDVSSYGTRSFNAGFLGTVEADLVRSAGAAARSARRTTMRDERTHLDLPGGVSLEGAAEAVSQMRGDQQAVARRSVPIGENTDRPYWRPIGGSSTYDAQDVRFRQHLQRLEMNDRVPGRVSDRGPVQQSNRRISRPAPVSGRTSAMAWANHPWITRGTQSSFLGNNTGHFGRRDNARLPNDNGTRFSSQSIIPTENNPLPGDSGCPSLISDDGMEPFDYPEAVADERGQSPVLQGLPEISEWEKEDSTMRYETSSEASSTLVQLNFDANELFSESDTEAVHDENIRADRLHANRLHTGISDGSDSERGRLSRAQGAAPPPIPPRHADHGGIRQRHPQGNRTRFRG